MRTPMQVYQEIVNELEKTFETWEDSLWVSIVLRLTELTIQQEQHQESVARYSSPSPAPWVVPPVPAAQAAYLAKEQAAQQEAFRQMMKNGGKETSNG